MSVLVLFILVSAIASYVVASRVYGRYLERVLGVDPGRPTPAHTHGDGADYVPTKPYVLFAHHFAAIAGAGPIIGPTLAFAYGVVPGLLWVVAGAILLGGVHDFAVLMVSIREGGRSVAEIARSVLGELGFALMLGFLLVCLFMITATFLNLSVTALTSSYPAPRVGIPAPAPAELAEFAGSHPPGANYPANPWMPTYVAAAPAPADAAPASGPPPYELRARIGGIASTSVLFITASAPLLGWLIYRRRIGGGVTYPLAAFLCLASVVLGLKFPFTVGPETWRWLMTGYVLLASAIPVWLLLMPRDFVNVQILYAGIAGVFAALLVAAVGAGAAPALPAEPMPLFNYDEGLQYVGYLWPLMFITVSCGAISGFHCLVSGGTSAKQLDNERSARHVTYHAMLLESLLAVTVILTLYLSLGRADYLQLTWQEKNPILAIALATGNLFHNAFGAPIWFGTVFGILLLEGFVVTTLDAAVRLNRYLLEEMWRMLLPNPPAWVLNCWFNTGLAVAAMFLLSRTNALPLLWRVFGTANQMMAAMALLVVAVWLREHGRRYWFALIPSALMFATTLMSAWLSLRQNFEANNLALVAACAVLMVLAAGVIVLAARVFSRPPAARG